MRLFFKCHREEDGSISPWYQVDELPATWPEGALANLYHRSTNIMYTVPGDSERYFLLDHGAICVNCTRPVDMAGEVYYESRHDKDRVICSQCRRDLDNGRLDKIKIEDADISDWIKRYEPL